MSTDSTTAPYLMHTPLLHATLQYKGIGTAYSLCGIHMQHCYATYTYICGYVCTRVLYMKCGVTVSKDFVYPREASLSSSGGLVTLSHCQLRAQYTVTLSNNMCTVQNNVVSRSQTTHQEGKWAKSDYLRLRITRQEVCRLNVWGGGGGEGATLLFTSAQARAASYTVGIYTDWS